MKIKRVKPRAKRVASALQFTTLTCEQAERLYQSFYESLKAEWSKHGLNKPKLIVLDGGLK